MAVSLLGISLLATACAHRHAQRAPNGVESVSSVVTADIQAAIEKHIAEKSQAGAGFFQVPFRGGELRLKLVRVHTEYLATLGPERYLPPELLVPSNENFQTIAQDVTRGHATDLYRARALYDHVIERLRYAKYGSGWGRGDAVYACDARSGNCSDFHAYFIALARAALIPARFAIGAAVPSERNDGGIDGYHCWAEFFAEGKWWPVDISEADKHSSLAQYYFGHHPANRIEFSRGRDLVIEPGPEGGPINFLAYPVLETGGRLVKPETTFLFRRDQTSAERTGSSR